MNYRAIYSPVALATFLCFQAFADEPRPLLEMPKKPNRERVERFFEGGFELSHLDLGSWRFNRDGTATSGGSGAPSCECREPVPYELTSRAVRFQCPLRCWWGDGSENTNPEHKTEKVELNVRLVSADLMLFDVEDRRFLIDKRECEPKRDEPFALECGLRCSDVLVEVIPGSEDTGLFDTVVGELRTIKWDVYDSELRLFIGPKASRPRTRTEVYFANEGEAAARQLARKLEPLIGSCEIKRWEGDWEYDVMIVVGPRNLAPTPAADSATSSKDAEEPPKAPPNAPK